MIRTGAALAVVLVLAGLVGCGSGFSKVEGSVTLDGKPVSEAVVTFVPDKGNNSTGVTDASGKFSITTNGKPGAPAGDYKVIVTKSKSEGTVGGDLKPGSPEYLKFMASKTAKPGVGPNIGPGVAPTGPTSELPALYGSVTTTTLTAKVPSSGPITLALTSKK